MQTHHYVMAVLVLALGYILGVKFPQYGAKVGLS
jgi:hypothetical protein